MKQKKELLTFKSKFRLKVKTKSYKEKEVATYDNKKKYMGEVVSENMNVRVWKRETWPLQYNNNKTKITKE